MTAAARIGRQWRLDAAYTHLRARENRVKEIRRPDDTASANLTWRDPLNRGGLTLSVRYNGRMTDTYFGAAGSQTKLLKAYTLVNLNGDIRVTRVLSLYGRVENAFEQTYEEVYGYPSVGRAG